VCVPSFVVIDVILWDDVGQSGGGCQYLLVLGGDGASTLVE